MADAYVLLAPYLAHDAPTMRDTGAGGWARPQIVAGASHLGLVGAPRSAELLIEWLSGR